MLLFMETQNLEVISVNIWQILISLINLLLLYLILKRFLFKPVQKILTERKAQVDRLYNDAEQAQKTADSNRQIYEDKLLQADEEGRAAVRRAMAKANTMSDEILSDTGRKVEQMMAKAEADIEQERKRARNDLKNEISTLSLDIAEKLVNRELTEEDHRKMIDGFISELGDEKDE